jgi:hypothetical protein
MCAAAVVGWFVWNQSLSNTTEGTQSRIHHGNISVIKPPLESGLMVFADYAPPESGDKPGGGPIVLISGLEAGLPQESYIIIDAISGDVLRDTISGPARDTADSILASIRIELSPRVWPIADAPMPTTRVPWGAVTFVQPDPESGFFVRLGTGFTLDGPGRKFLLVQSGNSKMTVDAETGQVIEENITDTDREGFGRFLSAMTIEPAR